MNKEQQEKLARLDRLEQSDPQGPLGAKARLAREVLLAAWAHPAYKAKQATPDQWVRLVKLDQQARKELPVRKGFQVRLAPPVAEVQPEPPALRGSVVRLAQRGQREPPAAQAPRVFKGHQAAVPPALKGQRVRQAAPAPQGPPDLKVHRGQVDSPAQPDSPQAV